MRVDRQKRLLGNLVRFSVERNLGQTAKDCFRLELRV